MSRIKNPQEKKRKSLQKDCRNTYGENDKATRHSIPKSKARQHQQERQARNQPLSKIDMDMSEEHIAEIVNESIVESKQKRLQGFRKWSDKPLGKVIQRQHEWRNYLENKQQNTRNI